MDNIGSQDLHPSDAVCLRCLQGSWHCNNQSMCGSLPHQSASAENNFTALPTQVWCMPPGLQALHVHSTSCSTGLQPLEPMPVMSMAFTYAQSTITSQVDCQQPTSIPAGVPTIYGDAQAGLPPRPPGFTSAQMTATSSHQPSAAPLPPSFPSPSTMQPLSTNHHSPSFLDILTSMDCDIFNTRSMSEPMGTIPATKLLQEAPGPMHPVWSPPSSTSASLPSLPCNSRYSQPSSSAASCWDFDGSLKLSMNMQPSNTLSSSCSNSTSAEMQAFTAAAPAAFHSSAPPAASFTTFTAYLPNTAGNTEPSSYMTSEGTPAITPQSSCQLSSGSGKVSSTSTSRGACGAASSVLQAPKASLSSDRGIFNDLDSDDSEGFEVVIRPWTEQALAGVKASCQLSYRHVQQEQQLQQQQQQEQQFQLQKHQQEMLQLQAQHQQERMVLEGC